MGVLEMVAPTNEELAKQKRACSATIRTPG
jgi:hypothetical protein